MNTAANIDRMRKKSESNQTKFNKQSTAAERKKLGEKCQWYSKIDTIPISLLSSNCLFYFRMRKQFFFILLLLCALCMHTCAILAIKMMIPWKSFDSSTLSKYTNINVRFRPNTTGVLHHIQSWEAICFLVALQDKCHNEQVRCRYIEKREKNTTECGSFPMSNVQKEGWAGYKTYRYLFIVFWSYKSISTRDTERTKKKRNPAKFPLLFFLLSCCTNFDNLICGIGAETWIRTDLFSWNSKAICYRRQSNFHL